MDNNVKFFDLNFKLCARMTTAVAMTSVGYGINRYNIRISIILNICVRVLCRDDDNMT